MKKRKFITTLFVMALAFLTVATSIQAATSTANVEFIQPELAPTILNPDNPNQDATDDQISEGNVTGEVGVLTLDFVSNLYFGEQKLSAKKGTYYALNEETPFAQVTDIRGTGEGWRLVAALSSFSSNEKSDSLPGASIALSQGEAMANDETKEISDAPEVYDVKLISDGVQEEVTIATPTETDEKNQGMGTWITRWQDQNPDEEGNQSVSLHVPAAVATEGEHEATITWTLYNSPTGDEVEPLVNPADNETE